jgi:hypothetical protein
MVSAAIEDSADLDITGRQNHVRDQDASLETDYPNTGPQIVPPATTFREGKQTFAPFPDPADVADSSLRTAALLSDVAIEIG